MGDAAILHDIGKIGIPDDILNKPGLLSPEERRGMMRHPEIGEKVIAAIKDLSDIAEVIRAHQEKFDGTGHPDHLRGEEIPLPARIIAVVDAYIAITDERIYKPARSAEESIQELIRHAGTQFDAQVVETFLEVLETEENPNSAKRHET
jgi:HD-GYP domain-containing protein (c-di-GMP phosphodiesterase class II)